MFLSYEILPDFSSLHWTDYLGGRQLLKKMKASEKAVELSC